MVNIAVNVVRMAIQAVGWDGTKGNGVDYFLTRTVVTGRTGTVTVSGDIM